MLSDSRNCFIVGHEKIGSTENNLPIETLISSPDYILFYVQPTFAVDWLVGSFIVGSFALFSHTILGGWLLLLLLTSITRDMKYHVCVASQQALGVKYIYTVDDS